jgi:hypothetical protein
LALRRRRCHPRTGRRVSDVDVGVDVEQRGAAVPAAAGGRRADLPWGPGGGPEPRR